MLSIWNLLLKKRALTYLLLIGLSIYGFYSLFTLRRESSPEVRIPMAVVSVVLPGASPEDVENLITNDIEDAVDNVPNIKKITSTSRESASIVMVEFEPDVDIDKSVQKVKDEVGKVQGSLPEDATDPVVTDVNFADQPIVIASITSDLPVTQFKQLADIVKSDLEGIEGVSRVDVSGVRDREVTVIVRKESLALYNLTLGEVIAGIASNNAAMPVGSIEMNGIDYTLSLKSDIKNPGEVQNIPVVTRSGAVVYLHDIALVSDGVENTQTISRLSLDSSPSKQAATLTVFKQTGADITRVSGAVKERIAAMQKDGPLKNETVNTSYDAGDEIIKNLSELSRVGLEAVALVMLMLLLTLGWREALVAALSVPLSFLVAFIGLKESGNTLNFVSLFSLILTVGILVDAAIVITEAIHSNLHKGMKKMEAARHALAEFSYPLTTGTLTTIAVFVPLFTISGVSGQFIASIPFTVIFVLAASLFVALGLLPLLAIVFLKPTSGSELERRQEVWAEKARTIYKRNLARLLDNRKAKYWFVSGLVVLFFVSLALPVVGLIGVSFFPQSDVEFLYIEIEKPQGTTLKETDLAARAVEETLYGNPDIKSFTTTVGAGSSFNQNAQQGPRFANITVNLQKEREHESTEVLEGIREKLAAFNTFTARVYEPNNGPPIGAPVLVTLSGNDVAQLKAVASQAKTALSGIEGTRDVVSSAEEDSSEFVISIDRAKVATLGLSPMTIAQTLRAAVYGVKATSIRQGSTDIDVVVKLNLNSQFQTPEDTTRTTIDTIRELPIATPNGTILLGSVIHVSLGAASDAIHHEDKERIVTVSSQLGDGGNARDIAAKFEKTFRSQLPAGVTMKLGGENEEVNQSFQDMFRALIFGIVLILVVLIVEFNSYRHSLFILVLVPLSLIGVMLGLLISGDAVSFPSMLGFIALAGVIVNHAIILVDVLNHLRTQDPTRPIREIVLEGSASRLRPIVLTTVTNVVGLIPLMFVSDLWRPIAISIFFGLSFAFVLTLILVPVLYLKWPGNMERWNSNGTTNI